MIYMISKNLHDNVILRSSDFAAMQQWTDTFTTTVQNCNTTELNKLHGNYNVYAADVAFTFCGNISKLVRVAPRTPNLDVLKRLRTSCKVAATRKYSCFRRSSFPSKNYI